MIMNQHLLDQRICHSLIYQWVIDHTEFHLLNPLIGNSTVDDENKF